MMQNLISSSTPLPICEYYVATPLIANWGRCLCDYKRMFGLTELDLDKCIIEYPAGLSSFNVEMLAQGRQVVSADRHYNVSSTAMQERAAKLIQELDQQLYNYTSRYQFNFDQDYLDTIVQVWRYHLELFLKDYPEGIRDKRYQWVGSSRLSFEDQSFELALCPDVAFRCKHLLPHDTIMELVRVAQEVRVFPAWDNHNRISAHLESVLQRLKQYGFWVEVCEIKHAIQDKANAMLIIRRNR